MITVVQAPITGLLVLILLFTGGLGSFFGMLSQLVDYARVHPGEQTAKIMPSDTDVYVTLNLRPGLDQLQEMKGVLSSWLDNPALKEQADTAINNLQTLTGISLKDGILPWIGPEVSVGLIFDPAYLALKKGPVPVLIAGTYDRAKSDAFVFGKWISAIARGIVPPPPTPVPAPTTVPATPVPTTPAPTPTPTVSAAPAYYSPPTGPTGQYRGVDVVYMPVANAYFALSPDYVIFTTVQSRLEAIIDLYLDGGDSLATTPGFQTVKAKLPGQDVRTETVAVPATPEWAADTGLAVTAGQEFRINAAGTWTSGQWMGGADGKTTPDPAPNLANTKIAFMSNRDGNGEVYVMNADGSNPTNLTNHTATDGQPAWSPDGTKIAFISDRDGNWEIYVMNADGSNLTNLTNHTATDGNPAWSPDGMKIAFQSDRDGNIEIYVMDADGTNPTNLTHDPAVDSRPAWSPDGSKIAFNPRRDGNEEIYVMNADGSSPVNLTNDAAADYEPAWSPDGTRIAFASNRSGASEIYVMNADGSNQTNLTNNAPTSDDWPAWSRDGTMIAFRSYRVGNEEIYVMGADGSSPVNLTNHGAFDTEPAWSPFLSPPDPMLPGAPRYSLIGKIGDGAPFPVGADFSGLAGVSGTLFLGMNDSPGMFEDNTGSLSATVTIMPTSVRPAMFYVNADHMLQSLAAAARATGDSSEAAGVMLMRDFAPAFAGGSAMFAGGAIKTDYYYAPPPGVTTYPSAANPGDTARIVPGGSAVFYSTAGLDQRWQFVKGLIAAHWADIKAVPDFASLPASVDDLLAMIKQNYGFGLEEDVLSWMTGEVAFAMLPWVGSRPASDLFIFEISDDVLVAGKIETIVNGINAFIARQGGNVLELVPGLIDGVPVTRIDRKNVPFSGGVRPVYAFLTVEGKEYLVFALNDRALGGAIDVVAHPERSLAQNGSYQWQLGRLPPARSSLGYAGVRQLMGVLLPQMPLASILGTTGQDLAPALVAPLQSIGFASGADASGGMLGTGILRIQPVPLRVYVDPPKVQQRLDAVFTVDVKTGGLSPPLDGGFNSAEFHLLFSPNKLEVIDADAAVDGVQIAPSVPAGAAYSVTQNSADNVTGRIDYAITLGAGTPSFTPATTLATITFRAIHAGENNIIFPAPPAIGLERAGEPPGPRVMVSWEGSHVRLYRPAEIIKTAAAPPMISLMSLFRGGYGPDGSSLVVEVKPNTGNGGVGVARVTADIKVLMLGLLPADLAIPPDRQMEWDKWLAQFEKWDLWRQGVPMPYYSDYDIKKFIDQYGYPPPVPPQPAGPATAPTTVYRRYLSLRELTDRLPWFLGDNNTQQVMARLRPGKFSVPVSVTDRWGNVSTASLDLTIVDSMHPLKRGWNLITVPVRLDDSYARWQDVIGLGDGLSVSDALIWDAETGWSGLTPTSRLEPLQGLYLYATANDQLGLVFSRRPYAPPVRDLKPGWNLVGPALSPIDWDTVGVGPALVSLEEDVDGRRGYSVVVNPGQQFDFGQDYRYVDSQGIGYSFGGYGWGFKQDPWVHTIASSPVNEGAQARTLRVGGGAWVFMEHPDALAGFSSTPVQMMVKPAAPEPGSDLPLVPRYDWERVTRTDYEKYQVDAYTRMFVKYAGSISTARVFEFYQKRMTEQGWQLTMWDGQADRASLTFRKEVLREPVASWPPPLPGSGTVYDVRIDIGPYGWYGNTQMQEISIVFERHEPGVDLPDLPRFDWAPVSMTYYNRIADDQGTHTKIWYQGNLAPDKAYFFYRDSGWKFGWSYVDGQVQWDKAWLVLQRVDKDGKTYSAFITIKPGVVKIEHHQYNAGMAPAVFYGNVSVDGKPALPGTPLAASIPGMAWRSMPVPAAAKLQSVWGSSDNDVFAAGDVGTILHFDGNAWSQMASSTDNTLLGIWGSSPGDVFAVGFNGAIVHNDGASWTPMSSPTTNMLYDVWGSSATDVFAVGAFGTVLHYNGTDWSLVNPGTSEQLVGIWGTSGSNVYVAGSNGTLLHYDGGTWHPAASGTTDTLRGLWGRSPSDIFAVGNNGRILHFDGTAWTTMTSNVASNLYRVSGGKDIVAVGDGGTVLRWDGASWKPMESGTADSLRGVWASPSGNMFAVGLAPTAIRYSMGEVYRQTTFVGPGGVPGAPEPLTSYQYLVAVSADNPLTSLREGGVSGDTVLFKTPVIPAPVPPASLEVTAYGSGKWTSGLVQRIDLRFYPGEPGRDLGDVPRYDAVKMVTYSQVKDTAGVHTSIRYEGTFGVADAYSFYGVVLPKFGWQLISADLTDGSASLVFRREVTVSSPAGPQTQTLKCLIDIGAGGITVEHHVFYPPPP